MFEHTIPHYCSSYEAQQMSCLCFYVCMSVIFVCWQHEMGVVLAPQKRVLVAQLWVASRRFFVSSPSSQGCTTHQHTEHSKTMSHCVGFVLSWCAHWLLIKRKMPCATRLVWFHVPVCHHGLDNVWALNHSKAMNMISVKALKGYFHCLCCHNMREHMEHFTVYEIVFATSENVQSTFL